jgi:hypothetical protein
MKRLMIPSLLALMFMAAPAAFGAHVSIGVQIGPPPPPVVYAVPAAPGPGYVWVGSYWYPAGNRWNWRRGYWTGAPYPGAHWLAPRYAGGVYHRGYWARPRGHTYGRGRR